MSGKTTDGWIAFAEQLAGSPEFAHYSLRSRFFVRRLRELGFLQISSEVQKLLPLKDSFKWCKREAFGIDEDAYQAIVSNDIEPILCFAHPRVIAEQPSLVLYYRCLAMISQKGLGRIASGNLAHIEQGQVPIIDENTTIELITTINKLLSNIVSSFFGIRDLTKQDLQAFLFAQAGTQIQGSWNNDVGMQGEITIREMLVRHLHPHILQVVWRDDTSTNETPVPLDLVLSHIEDIRVLRLEKGYHCIFASEPDVSLRNADNVPVLSVEVKAGQDPAGALERLGAAMKSFDHEKGLNPRLKTIYVVSCLTDEVKRRIQQDNLFHTYLLSQLIADRDTQRRFANRFVAEIPHGNSGD